MIKGSLLQDIVVAVATEEVEVTGDNEEVLFCRIYTSAFCSGACLPSTIVRGSVSLHLARIQSVPEPVVLALELDRMQYTPKYFWS